MRKRNWHSAMRPGRRSLAWVVVCAALLTNASAHPVRWAFDLTVLWRFRPMPRRWCRMPDRASFLRGVRGALVGHCAVAPLALSISCVERVSGRVARTGACRSSAVRVEGLARFCCAQACFQGSVHKGLCSLIGH